MRGGQTDSLAAQHAASFPEVSQRITTGDTCIQLLVVFNYSQYSITSIYGILSTSIIKLLVIHVFDYMYN